MAKMCPVCAVSGANHEKRGMCIHQKMMLGMMMILAVVVIVKLVT